jgi:hypothetical protein
MSERLPPFFSEQDVCRLMAAVNENHEAGCAWHLGMAVLCRCKCIFYI